VPGEDVVDAGWNDAGMGDPHVATITPRSDTAQPRLLALLVMRLWSVHPRYFDARR
jgi:hypothetical protein